MVIVRVRDGVVGALTGVVEDEENVLVFLPETVVCRTGVGSIQNEYMCATFAVSIVDELTGPFAGETVASAAVFTAANEQDVRFSRQEMPAIGDHEVMLLVHETETAVRADQNIEVGDEDAFVDRQAEAVINDTIISMLDIKVSLGTDGDNQQCNQRVTRYSELSEVQYHPQHQEGAKSQEYRREKVLVVTE